MPVYYAAAANVLPGHHAISFVPARWPRHELPAVDGRPAETIGPLSPRQREVLRLVAEGADVSTIAGELSISEATVRTHLRDALRRLGARNRAHAVALAIAAGLISLP